MLAFQFLREYGITPAQFVDLTIPQIHMIATEGKSTDREEMIDRWANRRAFAMAREQSESLAGGDGSG